MARTRSKKVYSLLGSLYRGEAVMRPLPPEQRDTEEKMIERERKVALFSQKNYEVLVRSYLYAEHPELCKQQQEQTGTARTKQIKTGKRRN